MPFPSTPAAVLPAWRFVPAAEVVVLDRWDADSNVRSTTIGASWRTVADLGGTVGEGVRVERTSAPDLILYRPSHLVRGVVVPDSTHLGQAPVRTPRAVGPGDVVVSKFLPPRAALVTPATPRHPPDANCLRVLGLGADAALWLVALLGHPSFAATLALRGAGSVLPRVGARDLAELRVPERPPELTGFAIAWNEAADERLAAQRDLLALGSEAQRIADDSAPPLPNPRRPAWVAAGQIPDTWAPDQAALVHFEHQAARAGWVPLGRHLAREPARLRDPIPPARVLRLVHATGDLGFDVPPLAPVEPPWFRLYADPLRPGELLLSTLGSAPKVVLNVPAATSTVWVSDQWARLDAGDTTGALALVLGTSQVLWQLGCAATGAVRQFIGREDLAEVRVPPIPPAVANALHRRVSLALERRRKAEDRLDALRAELDALVSTVVGGVE
jgi:hypothetical protein